MSERETTPEPQPVAPAPVEESPSSTGVVAGDEAEVEPADS